MTMVSTTSITQSGHLFAPNASIYEVVMEEGTGVDGTNNQQPTNGGKDSRVRSNSDSSSYGSIPKPSNWKSRYKLSDQARSARSSSGDASMVNPWHLLAQAQQHSLKDEAMISSAVWRVRQGWSPSSSLDRVPVRTVHPDLDFVSNVDKPPSIPLSSLLFISQCSKPSLVSPYTN